MRVAVAGKGGAGKTTISATLARLEARAGRRVIAVDGDSNPNLATALGIEPHVAAAARALPVSLVSRRLTGPGLVAPVDEVVSDHAVPGPDGISLVTMGMPGHADEGCMCSAHATVSALLGDLADHPGTVVLVDMEASPEHLGRGTTRHVDALLLVTEPYYRSLEACKRLAALAAELPIPVVGVVVNKVRSPADSEAVAQYCDRHGLTRIAEVPWSEEIIDADKARIPLIEAAPESAAVNALQQLTYRLHEAVQLGTALGGI